MGLQQLLPQTGLIRRQGDFMLRQAQALAFHNQAALLEGRVQNPLNQSRRQISAPAGPQGVARKGGFERIFTVQFRRARQTGRQQFRKGRLADPEAAFLVPAEGLGPGGQQVQAGFQGGGGQAGERLEPGLVGPLPAAQQQNGAGQGRAFPGLAVAGALVQAGQALQQVQLVGQRRVLAAQLRRQGADQRAPGHGAQGRIGPQHAMVAEHAHHVFGKTHSRL